MTIAHDNVVLHEATRVALEYLDGLDERPVAPSATADSMYAAFSQPLSERGEDPLNVIRDLAHKADPGLMAMPGPRVFAWVQGGTLPVSIAADWLTSAWDQNTAFYQTTPACAAMEEVAAKWALDLLKLPSTCSVGMVTGATVANLVGLAAARHAVLEKHGWDVEEDGLQGAPKVTVIAGEEGHLAIFSAVRYLGLGQNAVRKIEADEQGRMIPGALAATLAEIDGPTIVCAQAGQINTGAFDPFVEISALCREHGAWLHVDGAFGLWAQASANLCHLSDGVELADSWAVDAHKWLNVPYDSAMVIVRDPAAHRAATCSIASYLSDNGPERQDPMHFVPELSRRARGVSVYAALRTLGRNGVQELIERCCDLSQRMRDQLISMPGVELLNHVVLNQAVYRFHRLIDGQIVDDDEQTDAMTRAVIEAVQHDRTCYVAGVEWHGQYAMRIALSNWRTTARDISSAAILGCYKALLERKASPVST